MDNTALNTPAADALAGHIVAREDRDRNFICRIMTGAVEHVHTLRCEDSAVWAEFFHRGGHLDGELTTMSFTDIDHRAKWRGRAERREARRHKLALLWLYQKACVSYHIDAVPAEVGSSSPLVRFWVTRQYLHAIRESVAQLAGHVV